MSTVFKCDICGEIVEGEITLLIYRSELECERIPFAKSTGQVCLLNADICQPCREQYPLAYILSGEWRKE